MFQVKQENLTQSFKERSALKAAAVVWMASQYYKDSNSTTIVEN